MVQVRSILNIYLITELAILRSHNRTPVAPSLLLKAYPNHRKHESTTSQIEGMIEW